MPSKKGRFSEVEKRGYRGVDTCDNGEWFRSYDSKADKKAYGTLGVGMFATAENPQVASSDNAQLEGDDIGDFGVDGNESADFRRTSRNDGERG